MTNGRSRLSDQWNADVLVSSLHESLCRAVTKLKAHQRADGRWEGVVNFGCYPTPLALFACRFVDTMTRDWHTEVGTWIADQQKADGSWGSAWTPHGVTGKEFDELIVQQVRRNTAVAVLTLKLVDGFEPVVRKGEEWLRQHNFATEEDPLDEFLEAITGRKIWQQPRLVDYVKLLSANLPRTLPPWMVDLVVGVALATSAHDKRGTSFIFARLTRRRMTGLLLKRQLQDGSWFGTVDQTAYAILGLHLSGQDLSPEKLPKAIDSLRSRREASWRIVKRNAIPIWDTVRSLLALGRTGLDARDPEVARAIAYLRSAANDDGVWGSSLEVNRYPDCDDTALAFLALASFGLADGTHPSLRWLLKMQNKDGGWASFMHDNALRSMGREELEDPSTPDVTGHVLQALSAGGYARSDGAVSRALSYLEESQQPDGSWYGRWGICYIYGTSRVLRALRNFDMGMDERCLRKAIGWLKSIQNADGGWGEHPSSYYLRRYLPAIRSFASQTAWALEGLLSYEEATKDSTVFKGVKFLLNDQLPDGSWPSFPTSAAMEIFENSLEALISPLSALGQAENSRV